MNCRSRAFYIYGYMAGKYCRYISATPLMRCSSGVKFIVSDYPYQGRGAQFFAGKSILIWLRVLYIRTESYNNNNYNNKNRASYGEVKCTRESKLYSEKLQECVFLFFSSYCCSVAASFLYTCSAFEFDFNYKSAQRERERELLFVRQPETC